MLVLVPVLLSINLKPSTFNCATSTIPVASDFTMLLTSAVVLTLVMLYVPAPVLIKASPGSDAADKIVTKSPSSNPNPLLTTSA